MSANGQPSVPTVRLDRELMKRFRMLAPGVLKNRDRAFSAREIHTGFQMVAIGLVGLVSI